MEINWLGVNLAYKEDGMRLSQVWRGEAEKTM